MILKTLLLYYYYYYIRGIRKYAYSRPKREDKFKIASLKVKYKKLSVNKRFILLVITVRLKMLRWLRLASQNPIGDITVYKYCFCFSNFVTSETKESIVSRTTALQVRTLVSIGDVRANIEIDLFPHQGKETITQNCELLR